MRAAVILPLLCLLGTPAALASEPAAAVPELPALIECRRGVSDFAQLAPIVADPLKAVALGWQPLPQTNLFMAEYRLNTPITVFGHDSDHIAMAGATIVALLDLPDPRPLARGLELEEGVDTPDKVMYGRELVSRDVIDAETGEALIESVILSVSNVKSHPGKTLAGCTYSLDLPAEDDPPSDPEEGEPAAVPTTTTAPAG